MTGPVARALVLAALTAAAGGCRRGTPVAAANAADGTAPTAAPATAPTTATTPPAAAPAPAATTAAPPSKRFRRIDVHTHIGPDGIARAVRLMDEWGIDGVVNLSGMYPGPPRNMLETQLAAADRRPAAGASPCSPRRLPAGAHAARTTARRWPTS